MVGMRVGQEYPPKADVLFNSVVPGISGVSELTEGESSGFAGVIVSRNVYITHIAILLHHPTAQCRAHILHHLQYIKHLLINIQSLSLDMTYCRISPIEIL